MILNMLILFCLAKPNPTAVQNLFWTRQSKLFWHSSMPNAISSSFLTKMNNVPLSSYSISLIRNAVVCSFLISCKLSWKPFQIENARRICYLLMQLHHQYPWLVIMMNYYIYSIFVFWYHMTVNAEYELSQSFYGRIGQE